MKIIPIFISLLLISSMYCEDDEDDSKNCQGINKKSVKDCENLKLPSDYKYCCFYDAKTDEGEVKGCMPLKESEYNDIKKYIEDIEKNEKDAKINKLDCKSNYLKICLLSLLLLLA